LRTTAESPGTGGVAKSSRSFRRNANVLQERGRHRVVVWNLAANTFSRSYAVLDGAWCYLESLDPDLALVQEARPPDRVSERADWSIVRVPFKLFRKVPQESAGHLFAHETRMGRMTRETASALTRDPRVRRVDAGAYVAGIVAPSPP
jgi:hypothetical protein